MPEHILDRATAPRRAVSSGSPPAPARTVGPRRVVSLLAVTLLVWCQGCTSDAPPPLTEAQAATLAESMGKNIAAIHAEDWHPTPLGRAMLLLDQRPDWETHSRPLDVPRHPAEKHLKDMVIVLDPGQGGKAHVAGYKRGPTGVREAEMNLRVAKLLRRLLEDAGAVVHLTRESETSDIANDTLPDTLARRAGLANTVKRPEGNPGAFGDHGADLFLSIHHNAVANADRNFTSVWFHGEADWSEVGLDMGRCIGQEVGEAMRTQVALTGILMSDQQMYATGFGVLRHTRVPAVLLELSFYTNPDEEQRLRDAGYNLREAYGIYRGLCEYAYGGRPTQSVPEIRPGEGGDYVVTTTLDDGLPGWWGSDRQRVLSSTLSVSLRGEALKHRYDASTKTLSAEVPAALLAEDSDDAADSSAGPVLEIHHANLYKHHNWPQRYALTRDGSNWSAWAIGPRRASPPKEVPEGNSAVGG